MVNNGVDPELVSVINQRMDLLSALTEPRDKRELVEALDLSRSTVDRAVRQLDSLGLVTRNGEYRLTIAGQLVVSVFEEFIDDLDDIVRIEGLLAALPPDAPMAMSMVRDADVHWSSEPTPTEPVSTALDRLDPASRIRLLIPRISRPDVLDALESLVVDDGVPASFVLSRPLVEHLREVNTWLDGVSAAANCDLRVADSLPYTLGVFRNVEGIHVGIVVYDGEGNIQGFVENDTLRAYAWGETVFQRYFDDAVPLDRE